MLRREPPKFYVDRDQGRLHEEMLFERSRRAYWLTVDGLSHMSFTDAAFTPGRFERLALFVGARIDAPSVLELTTRYVRALFDHALRGAAEPPELRRSPYAFASLRRR